MHIPTNGRIACLCDFISKTIEPPLANADLIIDTPNPISKENKGSETAPVSAISDKPIFAMAIPVAISEIRIQLYLASHYQIQGRLRLRTRVEDWQQFLQFPGDRPMGNIIKCQTSKLQSPHIQTIDIIKQMKVKSYPKINQQVLA